MGQRNQKHFVLFLLYAFVSAAFVLAVSLPLVRELMDRRSLHRYVYSYAWAMLAASVDVAVLLGVLTLGSFSLYEAAQNVTAVELAQRQTYRKLVRHAERLKQQGRPCPPIPDACRPADHSLGSAAANLRALFCDDDHDISSRSSVLWAVLPFHHSKRSRRV